MPIKWHENIWNMFHSFKLWKLTKDLYSGAECCVKIVGTLSQRFTVSRDVHQGALLWIIFQVFTNPIIKEINCMTIDTEMSNIHLPCPALGNNLSLIAFSIYAMQQMINTSLYFSRKLIFKINGQRVVFWCMVIQTQKQSVS